MNPISHGYTTIGDRPVGQREGMSPEWKATRRNHLATYPECRACGVIQESPSVHHTQYRGIRGQSEISGDLVTLCRSCHAKLHFWLNTREGKRYGLLRGTLHFITMIRSAPLKEKD